MQTYQFDQSVWKNSGRIFPESVESDPWILFHGTSSTYEDSIERNGISSRSSILEKDDVSRIVAVYDEMLWNGESRSGFCNLKPFSLSASYGNDTVKPAFLAETAEGALLFASKDFAGGETVRSSHFALEDLKTYCANPAFRERHAERIERERAGDPWGRYRNASVPSVEWVGERIENLSSVSRKCAAAIAGWTHGVIFAVRMTPDDVRDLEYKAPGDGIRAREPIGSDRLVAKVIIPSDFEYQERKSVSGWSPPAYSGILATFDMRSY